jgi:hypothetical protein
VLRPLYESPKVVAQKMTIAVSSLLLIHKVKFIAEVCSLMLLVFFVIGTSIY